MSVIGNFLSRRMPTDYSQQTYASPYWFVRIPHRVRYQTALKAILDRQPTSLLDYGAGDGHLLLGLIEAGLTTQNIVAYEPVEELRLLLAEAIEQRGMSDRVRIVSRREELDAESFDFIACLEVLEHMPMPERHSFYAVCDSTLVPNGRICVEVPIEIGPTLLIKNITRHVLKGREREYTARALLRLSAGGRNFDPGRFDPSDTRTFIHDHKGFDYRFLRQELAHRYTIVGEQMTPLKWLPAGMGNQVVFFHAMLK